MTDSASKPTRPTMWCKHCEYALDGLNARRCPECGNGFDADNGSTILTETSIRREGGFSVIGFGIVAFVPICLPPPASCVGFPFFASITIAIGVAADRRIKRLRGEL